MNHSRKQQLLAHFKNSKLFTIDKDKLTSKDTDKLLGLIREFNLTYPDNTYCYDDTKFLQDFYSLKELQKSKKATAKLKRQESLTVANGLDSDSEHIKQFPSGRYVLTAAQNNTYVDKNFLKSLEKFCQVNGARLLVAKVTYNKNGFLQPIDDNELWYDQYIKKYIVEGHISLAENFHFLADANIIPTAKNPLSGFDGATKQGINCVLPASKISLKVSAALTGEIGKIIASTGFLTKRNYIMKKAGSVASIEHNIGAIFIDTEIGELRHLEQMQGTIGFFDLLGYYSPTSHQPLEYGDVSALQAGDIHAEQMEKTNLDNVLKYIDYLKPKNLIIHDLMDFSSRNHHNVKDCAFLHLQHVKKNTVRQDIEKVTEILDIFSSSMMHYGNVQVVESNHDLAINTWLKNTDFKLDPVNATVYLSCMLALYESQEKHKNDNFNMLQYAYKYIGNGKHEDIIKFNNVDDSLIIAGVQMANHGHNGVNGSRGSPMQFRSLGIPINTGHTHSPSIYGKCYTAGVTASLRLGYNKGASSWAIAHIVTYNNGQRQILFA